MEVVSAPDYFNHLSNHTHDGTSKSAALHLTELGMSLLGNLLRLLVECLQAVKRLGRTSVGCELICRVTWHSAFPVEFGWP